MRKLSLLFVIVSFFCDYNAYTQSNLVFINSQDNEKNILEKAIQVVPTPRQLRWQKLELTAFFHFGVNTFTDREWGTGKEDPAIFNPTQLNAKQWVQAVKFAGIRQVIITAKHHDGFCLWPSKFTEHSVKNSPWKNGQGDVVKEVALACQEEGIGFGVYLSPWDMNSKLYGTEEYNTYFVNQLTELLSNYGSVDEVWFDGANGEGPNGKKQVYDFERWYKLIRKLQPQATIAIMGPDVRWVGTESGKGRETEWSVIPARNLDPSIIASNSQNELIVKPMGDMQGDDLGSREKILKATSLVWYPAETDVSIRPGWFYHQTEDSKVKSAERLTEIYFQSVGRNGVLLLNIPPDRKGLLAEADVKSLREWKLKRDSIFQTNLLTEGKLKHIKMTKLHSLFDKDDSTACLLSNAPSSLEINFKKEKSINIIVLQENIRKGQRIEKFRLDYWTGYEWKTASRGTTVGYKRIISFDAISTTKLRLVVESARGEVYLSELGFYFH